MPTSIFTSQTPGSANANDSQPYTLGVNFYSTSAGYITGIRWYFPATLPSGTVTGYLWGVTDNTTAGTLHASKAFSSPVAGTWNTVLFDTPVAIAANTAYCAAIFTPDRYVATSSGFSSAVTNAPLTAIQDNTAPTGITLRNGKLQTSGTPQYPQSSFGAGNYFVDVVYESSLTVPPAPNRLWLTNVAADYTPPTIRGSWFDANITMTRRLGRRPEGPAATSARAETSATNNRNVLLGRWVSPPALRAGTFAGVMNWAAGVLESNAAANMYFRFHIFVTVGDTDVVRGVLRSEIVNTTEWISTSAVGRTGNNWDMTSTAIQAGDRIIVEAGYQAQNTVTTSYTGTLHYGNTGNTDLSLASANVTTEPGWIEFTAAPGLFWDAAGTVVDNFSDGTISSTLWPITFGSPTETGSRLRIPTTTGAAGVESSPTLALQTSSAYARLGTVPAASTATAARAEFGVRARAGQAIWRYDAVTGNLQARLDGCAVSDTFTRTVSDGWQAADTGQVYTITTGTASDFSTTGGRGRITMSAANSARILNLDQDGTNADIRINRLACSALPTGANIEFGVRARYVDSANYVEARVFATTANAVTCQVRRVVGGAETAASGFITVAGVTATTALSMRFQATGTTLQVRVWQNGSAEPGTWTASTTSTAAVAGSLQVYGIRNSGNTNTNPYIEVDDFTVVDLDGTDTPTTVAYNGTTHAWLRVREGAVDGGTEGTLYWDTSSDGSSWTNRRSALSPAWARFKGQAIVLRSWRDAGTSDYAEFFSVNTTADGTAYTDTIGDTVGAADAVTVAEVKARTVADTAPVADAVTVAEVKARSAADTVGTADAVTVAEVKARTVADMAPVADSVTAVEVKARTAADTVPVTDVVTVAETKPRTVADTVTFADAVSAVEVKARSAADTVGTADAVTVVEVKPRTVADTAPIVDTVFPVLTRARAAADTAPVTDAANATEVKLRTVADTAAIADGITAETFGPREVDDTVPVTDAVTAQLARTRTVVDTAPVADTASRTRSATIAVADAVPVADSLTSAVANQVTIGDPVGVADTAAITRDTVRQPAETVGVADTASTVEARARAVADTAPVADTATRAASRVRVVADEVGTTDVVTPLLGFAATPADTVPVVGTAFPVLTRARPVADQVALADATNVVEVKPRSVADTAPIADQITALLGFVYTPADAVPVTDQVTVTVARIRPVTDTVGLADAAAPVEQHARLAADTAPIADQVTVTVARIRSFTVADTAAISDTVIGLLSQQIVVGDTVQVVDDVTVRAGRRVTIGDLVGIVGQDFPVLTRGQPAPSQTVTVQIVVAHPVVRAFEADQQSVSVGAADTFVPITPGRHIVPVTYRQGGGQ